MRVLLGTSLVAPHAAPRRSHFEPGGVALFLQPRYIALLGTLLDLPKELHRFVFVAGLGWVINRDDHSTNEATLSSAPISYGGVGILGLALYPRSSNGDSFFRGSGGPLCPTINGAHKRGIILRVRGPTLPDRR